MRLFRCLLIGFCAVAATSLSLADDKHSDVRASYDRTTQLPNPIAFRMFLRTFDRPDSDLAPLVAQALNVPLNEESYERILQRVALFRGAREAIEEEREKTRFELLCPEDPKTRSEGEIYAALNLVDDVKESIAEKHYLLTINRLPSDERRAFLEYLQERKRA